MLLAAVGCEREQRPLDVSVQTSIPMTAVATSGLQPGPAVVRTRVEAPFDDIAWEVAQGQQLYNSMNCSGCHFQGGGGIGPALMDDEWIYGSEPQNIYETIVQGRPNGMPAFGDRLNTTQIWQLVSYVRSLSGQIPKGARSGRSDHMQVTLPTQQIRPEKPKLAGQPPSTIH